jgi:hypothetical protein
MLLALVGPNRSMCSYSKGLSIEIWCLLLKDVFSCLSTWQVSHNFFIFECNMRESFSKLIFYKFRKKYPCLYDLILYAKENYH